MSENIKNEQNQETTANAADEMEQRVADEQSEGEQTEESTGSEFFDRLKQKAQQKAASLLIGSVIWAAIAQNKARVVKDTAIRKLQEKTILIGAKSTKKFILNTIDESTYEVATIQDLLDTCDSLVEYFEPQKAEDEDETK